MPIPLRFRPGLASTLLLALLAASGCKYSFGNAAEDLPAGEVAGKAHAPGVGAVAGASVSLRGSALDQVTRPDGWFGLLPLPTGQHTLLLRQGLARARLEEVDLGYGSGGQVDGVYLGDLELPQAAVLSGTLSSVWAAAEGVMVDETTGMAVYVNSYSFRMGGLPIGQHRLVGATHSDTGLWLAGPVSVTVTADEAGTEKELAPIPLRSAGGTGTVHFRVESLVAGLDAADAVVTVTDADQLPVTVGAPDSNGDRDLSLAEGPYLVRVAAPPAFTDVPAPPPRVTIVLGGEVSDLGTFILAGADTIDAAQLSCRADADCAPGTCVSGVCSGYAPPAAASAAEPICSDLSPVACTVGNACDLPGRLASGRCRAAPSAPLVGYCIPCNASCTPDGAASIPAACP